MLLGVEFSTRLAISRDKMFVGKERKFGGPVWAWIKEVDEGQDGVHPNRSPKSKNRRQVVSWIRIQREISHKTRYL